MSIGYVKGAPTVAAALHRAFNVYNDQDFLGWRHSPEEDFSWMTYTEVGDLSNKLAVGLTTLLPRDSRIAICGANRMEWIVTDFASALNDFMSVGFHVSWPAEEIEHVFNDARLCAVVVDSENLGLFLAAAPNCPDMKLIVVMDGVPEGTTGPEGVNIISFADVIAAGEANSDAASYTGYGGKSTPNNPTERPMSDPITLIYSSGTSGVPKGISVSKERWKHDGEQGVMWRMTHKVAVSYSALAHGMDRGIVWQTAVAGGKVGIAGHGGHEELVRDMCAIEPAFFTAMPHFWNRIYSDFRNAVETALYGALAEHAGVENLEEFRKPGWDDVVASLMDAAFIHSDSRTWAKTVRTDMLSSFGNMLGRHLEVIGTGGAHTSDEVLAFLRECFGCNVVNSYGTTECPGISNNGEINEEVDLELVDVPELGYTNDDKPFPRGEIKVRCANMATEYYNNEAESAKAFVDGWYHTGDIGMIDGDGKLHIIDRKKNVCEIYLHGRSVWLPAAELESMYLDSNKISQIYLHSERSEDCLVAVVVPDSGWLASRSAGGPSLEYELMCELREIGREKKRAKHEIPRGIVVELNPWTIENGLLSATSKPKRGALAAHYKNATDLEYARLEKTAKPEPVEDYLDYVFTASMPEDAVLLNTLYAEVKADADVVRKLTPVKGAERRAAEEAMERDITTTKEQLSAAIDAALTELEAGNLPEGGVKAAAQGLLSSLNNLQLAMRDKHNKLEQLQTTPDEELSAAQEKMMADIRELEAAAELCWERVPYQIAAGQILLKREDHAKGVIGEGMGFPNWQVWCACCGDLIEWGSKGAGTTRYHSLEDEDVDYCTTCYGIVTKAAAAFEAAGTADEDGAKEAKELLLKSFPHPLTQPLAEEDNHSIWLRDAVVPDGSSGTPAGVISRAFEHYSSRMCVGVHTTNPVANVLFEHCGSVPVVYDNYNWLTYGEMGRLAGNFARALRTLVPRGSTVGITGPNSPQWAVTDFANAIAGNKSVGIHSTFNTQLATFVVDNADISVIVCPKDMLAKFAEVASAQASAETPVVAVVVMDAAPGEDVLAAASVPGSTTVYSFAELVDPAFGGGVELEPADEQPEEGPDSLWTLLYTSGSSGMPKGVIVNAKTFWADITEDSVFVVPLVSVSYIPLSHSSDRLKLWEFMVNGGRVGFAQYAHDNWSAHETDKKDGLLDSRHTGSNNVEALFAQIKDLRPTGVACPPRIWNGLFHIYNTALSARGIDDLDPAAARAAEAEERKAIENMFGGRIKFLVTGGAPTAPQVMEFAKSCFPGAAFHDSYGTTEAGGICEDGMPLVSKGVQLRLDDLTELGFTSTDKPFPRGEIVVKTRSLSSGYHKRPDLTAEAFVDGWYRTGDIGSIDSSGRVTILERVSAVRSLAGGELYFPNKLEAAFEGSKLVSQVFVFGMPNRTYLLAVVVPDPTYLATWSERHGVEAGEAVATSHPALCGAIVDDFTRIAVAKKLKAAHVPRAVTLEMDQWTPASGLINGQYKKIRPAFIEHYKERLVELYNSLPE